MIDPKRSLAARNLRQALEAANFELESMSGRVPQRIVKGHPVHTAWEEFRLTYPGGRLPRNIHILCIKLQRLSLKKDEEAFEVAEDLDGVLAKYSGGEDGREGDGPIEPRGFRWKGVEHTEIEPKPDRLIKAMYGHTRRPVVEIVREVWEDDVTDDDETDHFASLKSTMSKANAFLLNAGIPWCLSKRDKFIVCKPEE
jgi:hypothetical protein